MEIKDRGQSLRELYVNHGPRAFLGTMHELLEAGADKDKPGGLRPEDFSLRELWEAMVGPVGRTLGPARGSGTLNFMDIEEAVDSTAFPQAVGQLVSRKVTEGYEGFRKIGDMLVTNYPSRLKDERIVSFTHLQGPKAVGEGMPYEDSSFAEKYVTLDMEKLGRLLSITEEAVIFDQTGQILMRAAQLGEAAAKAREKTIVRGVIDADQGSSIYVYRPSGTGEALYASGNYNYISTATTLTDWTDIQEVLTWHATNVTDDRQEETADPITWDPKILLCPVAKEMVAHRIVNATTLATNTASAAQEASWANPYTGRFTVLSSPYIDAVDAYQWYLGDFKKQFIWKEVFPLQTMRRQAGNEGEFYRDIIAEFKVRYYGGINAIDEKWVVKVNATA